MTPEAQRIAIAEACGWKKNDNLMLAHAYPEQMTDPVTSHVKVLPDYLNDLNAMHEAEKVLLKSDDPGFYIIELGRAADKDGIRHKDHNLCIVCATAAQRAEAFLRTLGLWKE